MKMTRLTLAIRTQRMSEDTSCLMHDEHLL